MNTNKEKHHVGVDVPSVLYGRMLEYQERTGFSKSDIVRTALLTMFGLSDARAINDELSGIPD